LYENAKVKIYNHNKIISKEDIKNLLVSELIGRNKMSQLKTIINIPLNYSFVEKSGKISVKILIETKDCFIEIEILCTNLYFKFKDSNEVEKRREILLSLFKD
jgi:hypothetical protein